MHNYTQIRTGHGVSPAALKPALALLSRVIRARSNRIPLLQSVKLEPLPDDGMLRLCAADLDIYLSVDVTATLGSDSQSRLVKLADLQAAVKGVGQGRIDVSSLPSPEASEEDYPATPVLVEPIAVQVDAVSVGRLLDAFTCASADESRHVIEGVFLDPGEGGRLVATDGSHLVCFEAPWVANLPEPVILPDHKVWATSRSWSDTSGGTLRVGSLGKDGPTGFEFQGSNWSITGKCIEGCYPNYRQVIPSESQFVTRAEIDPKGVAVMADILEHLPGKSLSVGLRVTNHGLGLLQPKEGEQGLMEKMVPTSTCHTVAEVAVMLNRQYLAKALRFGLGRVQLIDAVSPVKFSGENGLLIVMPLRCEGPIQVRHAAQDAPGSASARDSDSPATYPLPDQSRKQTMRTNNHNGHGEDNGNRTPTPTSYNHKAEDVASGEPLDAALEQLGLLRDTLKQALTGLGGLTATLKVVRQQQRETEREIRTVRSTIRSLKELKL